MQRLLKQKQPLPVKESLGRLSKGVGVHRLIYINSNNPVCHTRRRRRARERSQAGDEDSHY